MANAVICVNDDEFIIGVFGEPAQLGYMLSRLVLDDNGSGKAFESPAHLAHDVVNALKQRGYSPRQVKTGTALESEPLWEYDLFTARNGQALVDVWLRRNPSEDRPEKLYTGRVKEIPVSELAYA